MGSKKYNLNTYTPEQYQKDKFLVDTVNLKVPYLLMNRVDDISEKRRILSQILGYKNLRVSQNKEGSPFFPLHECKNARIEAVLKQVYLAAKKRIKDLGNPLINPDSPFNPKNKPLEERLYKEQDGQLRIFR